MLDNGITNMLIIIIFRGGKERKKEMAELGVRACASCTRRLNPVWKNIEGSLAGKIGCCQCIIPRPMLPFLYPWISKVAGILDLYSVAVRMQSIISSAKKLLVQEPSTKHYIQRLYPSLLLSPEIFPSSSSQRG